MKEKLISGNIKGAHTAVVTERSGEAPVKTAMIPDQVAVQFL
jgi:hypothetical protein